MLCWGKTTKDLVQVEIVDLYKTKIRPIAQADSIHQLLTKI